jgi:hypothetical protein
MPRLTPFAFLLAALLALPLVACSEAPDSAGGAQTQVDPGLILNPRFEPGDAGVRIAHWSSSQHAGEPSYEIEGKDGVLVIRRIGKEPWGLVSQRVEASGLAGKQLEFSMELAGELEDTYGPALEPAGLVVQVMGRGAADLPMMGKRHLLVMTDDPGLPVGKHGWARRSLRFEMPEARDLELTVGVQMTEGGELRARAPQLRVLEDGAARSEEPTS